jgi:hypothetical protein
LFDTRFAAFDSAAGEALVLEDARQGFANAGLVVDDQNARALHARAST